ncbi:DUF3298 and DUF4163 domain-containing protein [Hymenobacter lutimineralis]|uniref:DUF3298 and DUF4163 domain-containing protein n=1 Tax=Hymenobacter lutimineralis TaxID=2606448 RepID=A0A5D6UQY2_9BACT|nr:DUF3298 and DUF4163 domain-containing protein [Hymenobacter lutimineralis]TYZ05996.1 DUF3298 and DUF4163 domain-containing protein [Hymenobacter lutimineralis]
MAITRFFLLGALSLAVLSCRSRSADTDQATTTRPAATAPGAASAADTPGATYAQYRGVLPGSPDSITLHLHTWPSLPGDTETEGMLGCYAGSNGQPFQLGGRSSASPDSVVLVDFSPEHAPTLGADGPVWRLRRQGHELTGTWNGKPMRLRLARPAGSLAFRSIFLQDSVVAFPKLENSPQARLSVLALEPVVAGTAASAVAAQVVRGLRGDTLPDTPVPALAVYWKELRHTHAQDYRQDMAALQPIPGDSADYPALGIGLNYEEQHLTHVLWNQAPLLSLGFYTYSFTGGAHGNYGTTAASFDTRTGRRLTYEAIFRPDAEVKLQPLLAAALRRAYHLAPDASLSEVLFDETLPVTHNVYLTSGGAEFIYVPYEVAAYAFGEVRLFVPLRELRGLLRPGLPLPNGGEVAAK